MLGKRARGRQREIYVVSLENRQQILIKATQKKICVESLRWWATNNSKSNTLIKISDDRVDGESSTPMSSPDQAPGREEEEYEQEQR